MIYRWKSDCACQHDVEVERPLIDIDKEPTREECACSCSPMVWLRVMPAWSKFQSQLVHGGRVGWHDECYVPSTGKPNGR